MSRSPIIHHTVDAVARRLELAPALILGRTRRTDVSHARRIAFYVIREASDLSYQRIGAAFNRDHSTVIYACRFIVQEMVTDEALAHQVRDTLREVTSGAADLARFCPHCDQLLNPEAVRGRLVNELRAELRRLSDRIEALAVAA